MSNVQPSARLIPVPCHRRRPGGVLMPITSTRGRRMSSTTRIPQAEITGPYGYVLKRFSRKMLGEVPDALGVQWSHRSSRSRAAGAARRRRAPQDRLPAHAGPRLRRDSTHSPERRPSAKVPSDDVPREHSRLRGVPLPQVLRPEQDTAGCVMPGRAALPAVYRSWRTRSRSPSGRPTSQFRVNVLRLWVCVSSTPAGHSRRVPVGVGGGGQLEDTRRVLTEEQLARLAVEIHIGELP
jgi:hypothetical protein